MDLKSLTKTTTTTTKQSIATSVDRSNDSGETCGADIYISPEKEAACLRKFDIYLLPVSVVFLVLATLDRNNVSHKSARLA